MEADSARSVTSSDTPGRLLPWRSRAFPLSWEAEFGGFRRLHLEVGFGDGRYTAFRAKEEADAAFVGLEISSTSLRRALKRLRREELDNVRLIKCGAQFAVRQLFAPDSLSSIIVNFPDPWPKERHEKNRLLRTPFFELAANRLLPGGAIRLATDHPDYLQFAKEQAEASELYTLRTEDPPAAVFETKYALKWKKQGKPLYYQVFEYGGAETQDYPHLERPDQMPHALLTGKLPDSASFEKRVLEYGGGHVILHEASRSLGSDEPEAAGPGSRWLLRVTVDEPDLRQQLLVVAKERSKDEVIVRLESFGDPLITAAVRGAVHGATEWLLSLDTGLEVKARNY